MSASALYVLVVEDHRDTLEAFGWFLEGLGCRYKLASDADLALQLARAEKFDVLITDVWLGGRDGYELVAELRRQRCLPSCVISMSVDDGHRMALRSKIAGCHKHLVKPTLCEELRDLLQKTGDVSANSHRMIQAMSHDVQAQRPLIKARQKGETSEVYWAQL